MANKKRYFSKRQLNDMNLFFRNFIDTPRSNYKKLRTILTFLLVKTYKLCKNNILSNLGEW